MSTTYHHFSSPIGELTLMGTDTAVTHILAGDGAALISKTHATASTPGSYLQKACAAIMDYLLGKTADLKVTVELGGTAFQRTVWNALRQIPYGTTTSYADIATKIGKPSAFRAVANACGDNLLPLIIPCHRVIHKNGTISGFAWGRDAKAFLLDMEKGHAAA